jgi:hypothetical protein
LQPKGTLERAKALPGSGHRRLWEENEPMRGAGWMAVVALGLARAGVADVWDEQTADDDTAATVNELVHGSDQVHDLAAAAGPVADEDWFRLTIQPYSSYEVVVDDISGDLGPPLQLDRVLADGTIFGSAGPVGLGFARSMRFHNPNPVVVDDKFLRVRSGGCTASCTPADTYRLRYYETTAAVPRFNDAGAQVTLLILQNATGDPVTGAVYFWDPAGALLASPGFTISGRSTLVMDTSAVPGVAGRSGSLTIGHDARYGELSGKTVAVAPAEGFSFDSPMTWRVR